MKSDCWKCEGCGENLTKDKVVPYGNGYAHIIAVAVDDGHGGYDPEPSPCGPVKPCTPIEEKPKEKNE